MAKKKYIKIILDCHLKDRRGNILDDEEVLEQIHELLDPNRLLLITDSAFEFLMSTHDIAVMARHRYTLKELNTKLRSSHFLIQQSTYLYFTIFPIVVLFRVLGKLGLIFSKPTIQSDLKQTSPYLNKFLVAFGLGGKLTQTFNFLWGSSLVILGEKR